jgi:hypothetical protein
MGLGNYINYLRLAGIYRGRLVRRERELSVRIVVSDAPEGAPEGIVEPYWSPLFMSCLSDLRALSAKAECLGKRVDFGNPEVEGGEIVSYLKIRE